LPPGGEAVVDFFQNKNYLEKLQLTANRKILFFDLFYQRQKIKIKPPNFFALILKKVINRHENYWLEVCEVKDLKPAVPHGLYIAGGDEQFLKITGLSERFRGVPQDRCTLIKNKSHHQLVYS